MSQQNNWLTQSELIPSDVSTHRPINKFEQVSSDGHQMSLVGVMSGWGRPGGEAVQ